MKRFILSTMCILSGLLVGSIILKLSGISPLEAYTVMLKGTIGKPSYLATIIVRSTPLILTGLSVTFAFRTGLFNIGAEGQFIIGALSAAYFGLIFNFNPWIQIPLVLLLAIMSSAIYGGVAGFLKARFGVHEVISTIMLNWIALYFSNFMVMTKNFHREGSETSQEISSATAITLWEEWKFSEAGMQWLSQYPTLQDFMRPPLHAGIFIAIFAAIMVWFILKKTTFGFKLRAVGLNPEASRYAGIDVNKKLTQSMMISGALAGTAGATHVIGVSKNIAILAAHEGYGFDGIAVSLIGSATPSGTLISGFFLGALKYSGSKLQSALEAPSELISIMIGAIIFFIAIPVLFERPIEKMLGWRKTNG